MKKILLIATGGTIASGPTKKGLAPLLGTDEILACVPEISEIARVNAVQLFNIDSAMMTCEHWIAIARCIKENYDNYDGFVITHGTDTMAYTASALSYLVKDSVKPIVLTGAQKSIYMRDTDARNNLYDAFVYAVHPSACLVHIVFEGKIIIGNRARKTRTKSYNAFSSVDFPEVGVVRDGRVAVYIEEKASPSGPELSFSLCPRVFVLKLIPGEDFTVLDRIKDAYSCVVIESFGVGNLPVCEGSAAAEKIAAFISGGGTVVVTTQVPHEGSDMSVYEAGSGIKSLKGVIEAYDMTLEAVVTKLMWILAKTSDREEIRKLFYTTVQKDIF